MAKVYVMEGTVTLHGTGRGYRYYAVYLGNKPFLEKLRGKRVYLVIIEPEEGVEK